MTARMRGGRNFQAWNLCWTQPYRTAREHVPDRGVRIADTPLNDMIEELRGLWPAVESLESDSGSGEVNPKQHADNRKGRAIIRDLGTTMEKARKANLIDYPVATSFGDHSYERTGGGYKTLTDRPDPAPYSTWEEAARFRYPDSWIEKEQS